MGEPEKGGKPEKMYSIVHEVQVENDLWYDETEGIVPFLTDIEKMPPHNKPYPPRAYSDEIRYSDWESLLEETYFTRHRLPKSRQTIVVNHAGTKKVCDEVIHYIEKDGSPYTFVGLDTEKDLSTYQFSVNLRNARGPGRDFERNILFQMMFLMSPKSVPSS